MNKAALKDNDENSENKKQNHMKAVSYQNPEARLQAIMQVIEKKYVRTCHSDTCGCFSHDSGYTLVTGFVPDEVETVEVGGSVHSHARTIRVDDAIGQAKLTLASAKETADRWHVFRSGSSAGRRMGDEHDAAVEHAERVLQLVTGGVELDAARTQSTREQAEAARVARREKRQREIAGMVAAGMAEQEARTAYGVGQWSNEIDWPAVKRSIEEMGRDKAHRALSECANAPSRRVAEQWADGLLMKSSHPRMTAWATYALQIFFGGKQLEATGRDYPVEGNGWRLVL